MIASINAERVTGMFWKGSYLHHAYGNAKNIPAAVKSAVKFFFASHRSALNATCYFKDLVNGAVVVAFLSGYPPTRYLEKTAGFRESFLIYITIGLICIVISGMAKNYRDFLQAQEMASNKPHIVTHIK
jgi:hypothetical protein